MYPTMPTKEIAEYFNTTEMNILKQAENFGIKKIRKQHPNRTSTHKYCSGCKQWKPHSEFWKNKYGNPASECKLCNNKRKMNYVRRNPDKLKEWRDNYYWNNRERLIRYQVERARRNPEKANQRRRRWIERHPERYRAISEYRAHIRRMAAKDTDLGWRDTMALKRMFVEYGRCPICGKPVDGVKRKWWVEHDVPISRGGKHERKNVIYDCSECNKRKGVRTLKEFCGMTVGEILEKVQKKVKEKVA